MARKSSGEKKRLTTLAKKTTEQKTALLEHLAKYCIVQLACERGGVGRSTYYKWRTEDEEFMKLADKALNAGRAYLNDIAMSGLLKKMQEGNTTSLIFWLKNNHVWFSERVWHQHTHEHQLLNEKELPPEQREEIMRALRILGMSNAITLNDERRKKFMESIPTEMPRDTPRAMTEEEHISDWGTGKQLEQMREEVERESKSINIADIIKRLDQKKRDKN